MLPRCMTMIVLSGLLVACGSAIEATMDANDDTGGDTGSDTAGDVPVDTAPDPGEDPVVDTSSDTNVPDTAHDIDPTDRYVGDACLDDHECTGVPGEGRFCLDLIGGGPGFSWDFPGGYCSARCARDEDCGPGGECVPLMGGEAVCFKLCSSGGDCRTSETYTCQPMPGPGPGDITYCLPPPY